MRRAAAADSEETAEGRSEIAGRLNLVLGAAQVIAQLYLFFLLPLYFLPKSPWWGLTLVLVPAVSNPFWSLIHEAIHDIFHPASQINRTAGRVLSIFFGAPFRVLRASHLIHHKFNRTPLEGTEFYDPQKTSRARARLGYYFYVLGGLYLLEFVSPLPFFMPRVRLRAWVERSFDRDSLGGILFRSLMSNEAIREMRRDGLAVLALFGLSALCYGKYWALLVAALGIRAFLISFLDNVYHYATPVNGIFYAHNLWLPGSIARGLLYFNLHGIHHRNPAIPWTALSGSFDEQRQEFADNYFIAALRQLRGPVPLSELPQWSPSADRPAHRLAPTLPN